MDDLFICTTLKRLDNEGETVECDAVIYFTCDSYHAGTRHTHPGGHWNSHIGSWDPPDDPEAEFSFLRAEFDGAHDDAPDPLTEAETATLREWFETHQGDVLQRYLDQE